jgi:hypothetical protein
MNQITTAVFGATSHKIKDRITELINVALIPKIVCPTNF